MWAAALLLVVGAMLFAMAGDWWLVVIVTGVAASAALSPEAWKIAYRLGHERGYLEALEDTWGGLGNVAERVKAQRAPFVAKIQERQSQHGSAWAEAMRLAEREKDS